MADTYRESTSRFFDSDATGFAHSRWFGTPVARSDYAMTEALLLRYLQPGAQDAVLEVGCGPGVWTALISQRVRTVTALDVSQQMLAEARQRVSGGSVSYVHRDVMEYESSTAFDKLYSVRAIEYIPDKPALAEKLHSLIRPGGRLVIVTKPRNSVLIWRRELLDRLGRRPPENAVALRSLLYPLDPGEMASVLAAAGFQLSTVAPVLVRLPWFGRSGYRWIIPFAFGDAFERAMLRAGNVMVRRCQDSEAPLRRLGLICAESYVVVADRSP